MAKVKTFPCYCYAVTTATLVTPQPKDKCFTGDRCRQPWCYHHEMVTAASLEAWMVQKLELEAEFPHLANPSAELKSPRYFFLQLTSFGIIAIHMTLPFDLHHYLKGSSLTPEFLVLKNHILSGKCP
jgi:hypothetical protein